MTEQITERFITEERSGVHDATVMQQYIPPPGGEVDLLKAADMALAKKVYAFLKTRMPVGYDWRVVSDQRQGVLLISIPVLMGVCHFGLINLRTTPIADGVVELAGQILERYGLSRTVFNVDALLEARAKYSALVVPTREVPN